MLLKKENDQIRAYPTHQAVQTMGSTAIFSIRRRIDHFSAQKKNYSRFFKNAPCFSKGISSGSPQHPQHLSAHPLELEA
jgi:hypothetical protein